MASRGYCWGRHLRLMLKAFGCKQGSGEATSEGEEGTPEGLGAKSDERRLWIPEGKRRGGVHSEGSGCAPKEQAAKRLKDPLRLSSEDPRSRREAK